MIFRRECPCAGTKPVTGHAKATVPVHVYTTRVYTKMGSLSPLHRLVLLGSAGIDSLSPVEGPVSSKYRRFHSRSLLLCE